jgi:energy-coupling factor transporter ATP-binding protein EcfA2
LISAISHFKGTQVLTQPTAELQPDADAPLDLADIKGQESAKRALEIAAAGGHHLLMIGPPGSGKSMLAARLPGLLPPLEPAEALEVSMIHSVAGLLDGGRLMRRRPFRDPHHSASTPALVGGGQRARPGEISLAHRGVLFLDELPEFQRATLESLRQPIESGRAVVARANAHVAYPARVQLIAAMNPCRCGHVDDPTLACGKAPRCVQDYQSKISGPLFDRIDLHVEVPAVSAADLSLPPPRETSLDVAARVRAARTRQPEAVGARLSPRAARRAHARRHGRQRRRAPRPRRRGAELPAHRAGAVTPVRSITAPRPAVPDTDPDFHRVREPTAMRTIAIAVVCALMSLVWPAAAQQPFVKLFKVISAKDEVVIAVSDAELRSWGPKSDLDNLAQHLVDAGQFTAWQYAVKHDTDGSLIQAPLKRIAILKSDSLRIEPFNPAPLKALPLPAN